MRHFFANFIAMFFISKKLRRRIRCAIMRTKNQKSDDLEKKYNYLKSEWLTKNNGKLLLPGRFSEYDLIFAIGATCHTTNLLDYFKLRRFTSPFDWTGGKIPVNWYEKQGLYRDSQFHTKIQSLFDNFKDWTNPENFEYISQLIPLHIHHHYVINIKTKIRHLHDFPVEQDIIQYMPEFMKKMHKRIDYLYNAINESKKILVIWISNIWDQRALLEQNVSDKDIKWAVEKINKIYPNKMFDFVFFEHDGSKERFKYEKIEVAPGAFRIKSNHFFNDSEYDFLHPVRPEHNHIHVISEALDNIHLSKDAFKLKKSEANIES